MTPSTISIVTPSYNQADFLPECIESVAKQSVPALEHLVFDPGSTDGSQDVAKRYASATLFEEADSGQSDAVAKGMKRSTGDIVGWLNSDDCFADERVFERVLDRFNQADQPDIVYGKGYYIGADNEYLRDIYVNERPDTLPQRLHLECGISQPALFMKRSVIEKVGVVTEDLHYCMDYEYWIRCTKAGISFAFIPEYLSVARYHIDNKTYGMRGHSYQEVCEMLKEHFNYASAAWLLRYAEYLVEGFDGVLASSASSDVKEPSAIQETFKDLLVKFNGDYDTLTFLQEHQERDPENQTVAAMKEFGVFEPRHFKSVKKVENVWPLDVKHVVGERTWAFDRAWKTAQIARFRAHFTDILPKPKNDVCVIVGNGPSLKDTNLDLLANADTIISNNAFLSSELKSHATYYTVVNYLVAEQHSHQINMVTGVKKVLPFWLAYCLSEGPDTYFVNAMGRPEFSTDMFLNMSWRHTVSFFNMHLAYGLGYRRVLLIGFDHSYVQPDSVKEGDIIVSEGDDPNHFDPRYFRQKRWQAADVDKMEEMYGLARAAFEADGRQILNCTVGGQLELFSRSSLEAELTQGQALSA